VSTCRAQSTLVTETLLNSTKFCRIIQLF